jgi:hypothetical protein
MDADVTISEGRGWEITLGADFGNCKINIPEKGYPLVSDR